MTNPHFAWLPPEINSALMFAGPGAAPLIAAAAAWNGLAQDLASAVASFGSVTSELTSSSWLGASSAAMMAVATQYMAWLSAAAAQAEQAAEQVMATVTAFETALAAIVQPAVVAANRGLIQLLAATNYLGINTPAIMDIEAAYEQMWASDVAAMAGYHFDASAVSALLAPWQKVLQSIGIDIGENGEINLGWGNTGSGNIGSGNTGSGNIGSGNTGSGNIGSGNTGNNNVGLGNWGNGNIGFGNTGYRDIGFGLTGGHQIGFGGFNSGSGNTGLGNSGTGNSGFFNSGSGNMGIGNSGTQNTGIGNSGTVTTGLGNAAVNTGVWNNSGVQDTTGVASQVSTDTSVMSAGYYADTSTISAGSLSANILNSVLGHTGGLSPALASSSACNLAPNATTPTGPAGGLDSGNPNAGAGSATANQAANAGLRNTNTGYTGFFNSGTTDSGVQHTNTPPVRGLETASSSTGSAPSREQKSNFYQTGERASGDLKTGMQQQSPAE